MSTKIYNAHLWLGTAEELADFCLGLRKQYISDAVQHLSRWDEAGLRKYSRETYEKEDDYFFLPILLRDEIRKGENTPFNFDASVVAYFHSGKIVAIPFGLRMFPQTEAMFKSNPKMKFYGYWNNSDPDEDCSEEEWNEREEFFETLFDGEFFHFGSLGFAYELSNQETLWKICDGYREAKNGKQVVR